MNSIGLIRAATPADFESVIRLLQSEDLPVEDLDRNLPHFFVVEDNKKLLGAIGLEVYGTDGLLRSMIVDSNFRGQSIARALLDQLLGYALSHGVKTIYLITTTAEGYFNSRGFSTIIRDMVPPSITASKEFTTLCPSTAIVMLKRLS